MSGHKHIGAVVIGRNEGDRLVRCLTSLKDKAERLVYVDSGSTDDSVAAARKLGAEVVVLDTDQPFTAARARNVGLAHLNGAQDLPEFVQFIDGDCELQSGWIETADEFLRAHPEVAVACGRRRERFPEKSIYNALSDQEWDTPIGEARACGGDALMRVAALKDVVGFNDTLIAGEEPELCVRLRKSGWKIWRLDAEMTLHDAALTRFGQWWKRARRAGHAYAEGAAMHGRAPEHHCVPQLRRIVFWGLGVPLITVLGLLITPWALLLLLIWPAQVLRLRRRGESWATSVLFTLGKIPETQGALGYWRRFLLGGRAALIEYK